MSWSWGDIMRYIQLQSTKETGAVARFKKQAYAVLLDTIQRQYSPDAEVTCEDIYAMNITKHMKDKLCGLIKISPKKYRTSERLKAELLDIPGIGAVTADQLVKRGLKSVAELRKPKWLPSLSQETKIHLEKTPESRIPRAHIAILEPILIGYDPENVVVAGSYRRKLAYSGDIDCVLVSDNPNALQKYLKYLRKYLDVWPYSEGRDKMSLLVNTGEYTPEPHTYKMDVMRTDPDERYSMLLYLTGSKPFNIRMRTKAARMGYLLNQNGLFDRGRRLPIDSEEGYFTMLGMEYLPPEKRY
jgi:DNA polymerase (family 10)